MGYALAIDPGNMTGWAYLDLNIEGWDPDRVTAGQTPSDLFCDWVADTPQFRSPEAMLIVETFTVTRSTAEKSPQPVPIEVIGVMKFLARRANSQIFMQLPADAKNFVTDKQMKKIGLWKPGKDHARDAIRHLVLGLVQHGPGQVQQELLQSLA